MRLFNLLPESDQRQVQHLLGACVVARQVPTTYPDPRRDDRQEIAAEIVADIEAARRWALDMGRVARTGRP